jgi:hypothetical protein
MYCYLKTILKTFIYLVVLCHFEVGEGCGAACRVGHDPEALVDEPLIVDLLEDPPDGLHEPGVHGFVVILEIDPSPHSPHDLFPFF